MLHLKVKMPINHIKKYYFLYITFCFPSITRREIASTLLHSPARKVQKQKKIKLQQSFINWKLSYISKDIRRLYWPKSQNFKRERIWWWTQNMWNNALSLSLSLLLLRCWPNFYWCCNAWRQDSFNTASV